MRAEAEPHELLVRDFLETHPEYLPDCRRVRGELVLTVEGTIAFVEWSLARGFCRRPAAARAVLAELRRKPPSAGSPGAGPTG